jgi:hypothetical protein
MTDGENPTTDNEAATPRDVPVDWEALEDAFENNAPEVHSYLHLKTGEVLRVVDGIADPEMHSRIASDTEYMRIEPVSSREQYRWMERFIPVVEEPDLGQKLLAAIDGKGAFRRFKDVLMGHVQERERWFAFRSERLRVFMEAWLGAHALRPVPRPVFAAEPPLPLASEPLGSTPDATSASRRGRGMDQLRRQLKDVTDALGGRDLEKVLVFAEFVRARRTMRSHPNRDDSSGGETPSYASNEADDPGSEEVGGVGA